MASFFDGRDITDTGETSAEVRADQLSSCRVCGAVRDARFPFCCELAAFTPLGASRQAPVGTHANPDAVGVGQRAAYAVDERAAELAGVAVALLQHHYAGVRGSGDYHNRGRDLA